MSHVHTPLKIYTSPDLLAEYRDLETEIRSLDVGVPLPPPTYASALAEMRGILDRLKAADI
jgi:hypothetical protein